MESILAAVAIDVDEAVGVASIIVVQYSRWANTIVLITRCGSRFKCRSKYLRTYLCGLGYIFSAQGYQSFANVQRWSVSARGLAFTDV